MADHPVANPGKPDHSPTEVPSAGGSAADSATAATPAATASRSFGDRVRGWSRTTAIVLVSLVAAVVVYFILAAFLPRWWAGVIGRNVDGSFGRGIGTGLTLGFVCTFVPLLLIGFAVLLRGRWKNVPTVLLALLGVAAAIPNLLTLSVVLGGGSAAHAGQRIFDVQAPGFRASTLWGAIIAVVVFAAVAYFIWAFRRRGQKLRES